MIMALCMILWHQRKLEGEKARPVDEATANVLSNVTRCGNARGGGDKVDSIPNGENESNR